LRFSTPWLFALFIFCCVESCERHPNNPKTEDEFLSYDTIKAWDISTYAAFALPKPSFLDSSNAPVDLLAFAKKNGINTLRLRILNGKPAFPHPTIPQLLSLAMEAKQHKLAIWLDFHYSDVWADPGNQATPKNWEGLSLMSLRDSVYEYTHRTVNLFVKQGTSPAVVQIGNEISPGMLWPVGKFVSAPSEAKSVVQLFMSGVDAVKSASPKTKTMLHIAGNTSTLWWVANEYLSAGINFDLWGFSYYGNWHGCDADIFMQTCQNLSTRNGKPFVVAETAHPFTLGWQDQTGNVFGTANQICPTFDATASKQKDWLNYVWSSAKKHPGFRGLGYWEPAWVTENAWSGLTGSPWENMALFDFHHKALPGAYFSW
jgi:arabinogalactan endo-1,4-beta-galactosidase